MVCFSWSTEQHGEGFIVRVLQVCVRVDILFSAVVSLPLNICIHVSLFPASPQHPTTLTVPLASRVWPGTFLALQHCVV